MLIIDDTRKCPICGAYPDGRGYCSNGHVQKDEYIMTPDELRAITEQQRERQWVKCMLALEYLNDTSDKAKTLRAVVISKIDKEI